MDRLKGIERKSKPPIKYMIQLFGDCYSAISNLQGILHAPEISGCMLRSAVTNGLICCTCAAWKLYSVISYVLKYISIRVPKSVIPTSSFPICLQNNRGDWPPYIYYRITCSVFPNWFFIISAPLVICCETDG